MSSLSSKRQTSGDWIFRDPNFSKFFSINSKKKFTESKGHLHCGIDSNGQRTQAALHTQLVFLYLFVQGGTGYLEYLTGLSFIPLSFIQDMLDVFFLNLF